MFRKHCFSYRVENTGELLGLGLGWGMERVPEEDGSGLNAGYLGKAFAVLASGSSAGEGLLSPWKPGYEPWLVCGGHKCMEHGVELSVELWWSGGQCPVINWGITV